MFLRMTVCIAVLALLPLAASAQEVNEGEEFQEIKRFELPQKSVLERIEILMMPDGTQAITLQTTPTGDGVSVLAKSCRGSCGGRKFRWRCADGYSCYLNCAKRRGLCVKSPY